MKPMMNSKLSFALMMLVSSVVLLQMGLFIAHQVWDVQFQWNVFQYCLSVLQEASLGHNIVKILFNLLIVYTISRMLWRVLNQWFQLWKWNRIFLSKKHDKLTKQVNHQYREWKSDILVVEDDAFVALTMGALRPQIIISSGLLNMFPAKEAEAILLHEHYHYIHKDPLKAFLFAVITDGLGYIPIIKAAAGYYKTWKELLADRFVVKQMRSEFYLGNVLLRLTHWVNLNKPVVGVYFADAAINYRILQILEPEKPLHIPFFHLKTVMVSVSMLLVMLSVVIGGCT